MRRGYRGRCGAARVGLEALGLLRVLQLFSNVRNRTLVALLGSYHRAALGSNRCLRVIALPPDRKELGVPSPGRSAVRRSHSFARGEAPMTAAQALIYG